MATWRDIKSKALAKVHSNFQVPAVYWTHAAGTPLAVNVRDHTTQTSTENDNTWVSTPGFYELNPILIFDASELPSVHQKAYVFMGPTEVYITGTSRPPKDGYIAVDVTPASSNDIAKMLAALDMGNLAAVWDGILP